MQQLTSILHSKTIEPIREITTFLGPNINSKLGDFRPFMQPRGKKLYFSRTEVKDGKRIEDLYSIDFSPKEWKAKLVK